MSVVTIAARNYLPRVAVLATSYLRANPGSRIAVCVMDDRSDEAPLGVEGLERISLHDLDLDRTTLRAMSLLYDVTEFSTALKPWVIEAAIRRWDEPVLYLDPDIEVHGRLGSLTEAADGGAVVLTPHVLQPIPRDGMTPDESLILRAGMYNLGFVGCDARAEPFLAWWKDRLVADAISDPANGLFTDQRWVDFVPSLFPHVIWRDPGCNVAYWNAHERPLEHTRGGAVTAAGEPLRFLHYSGYDPRRPHLLSRYAAPRPRVRLSEHPVLRELCDGYGRRIGDTSGARYGWDVLPNGVRIDGVMRRLYRDAFKSAAEAGGDPCPDLLTPDGVAEIMAWLEQPVGPRGLPRYAQALLDRRPDVAAAYYPAGHADDVGFATWLRNSAASEMGSDERLVRRVAGRIGAKRPVAPSSPVGTHDAVVEVVGLFAAEMGVGEAARRTHRALSTAGVAHRIRPWRGPSLNRQLATVPRSTAEGHADVAVVHVNADVFGQAASDPELGLGSAYTIGAWFWELEEFPECYRAAFDHVDEVWAATHFIQSAVDQRSPVPVVHMPVPLEAPVVDRSLTRQDLGLDGRFTFLFLFDLYSVMARKNPLAVVEAFRLAFPEGSGARLVVKTINGDAKVEDLEHLRYAAAGHPDISVVDGYLDQPAVGALQAAADCYVSLHRSEGLGLTLAESMALGTPVVATAYSGNIDFMTPDNSYLVGYDLTPVGPGCAPYPADAKWAEPDVDDAARCLRAVVNNPEEARRRAERARADLATQFSAQACGDRMARRIAEIRGARD